MKIKKFNEINEWDPYGEKNWNDKKDFAIRSMRFGKIIYVAYNVENEEEAREQLKKHTGVTDEYGELYFQNITLDTANRLLREKGIRLRALNDEIEDLETEINSLQTYLNEKK